MENSELLAKRFWNQIFGDDFEFLDSYFKTYYEKENLIIDIDKENNEVRYMSLIVPYDYNYYGKIIKIAYITAISTNPKYRGMGMMKKNMEEVEKRLKEKEIIISCLIPANETLRQTYNRYGYVECFTKTKPLDNNKSIIHNEKTYNLYNELGYNIEKLENHKKGMIKIINPEMAIELYLNHNKEKGKLSQEVLKELSQEQLTKEIFENSFMNLMFDV